MGCGSSHEKDRTNWDATVTSSATDFSDIASTDEEAFVFLRERLLMKRKPKGEGAERYAQLREFMDRFPRSLELKARKREKMLREKEEGGKQPTAAEQGGESKNESKEENPLTPKNKNHNSTSGDDADMSSKEEKRDEKRDDENQKKEGESHTTTLFSPSKEMPVQPTQDSSSCKSTNDDACASPKSRQLPLPSMDRSEVQILTPQQRRQCQEMFWKLQTDKWKECIDREHRCYGRFVYDLCLHKGNAGRKEIGYLSSMYDAWCFASDEIGYKSNANSWTSINRCAMSHPGNEIFRGRFRHLLQGNLAFVSTRCMMDPQSALEFNECQPKRLAHIINYGGKNNYSHERKMPPNKRKYMRNYVRRYIHEFYKEVGLSNTQWRENIAEKQEEEKQEKEKEKEQKNESSRYYAEWKEWPVPKEIVIPAITRLNQRLSRMEPSRDGNTRTMVVLINKLLCECGHHPLLYPWPDGACVRSFELWKGDVGSAYNEWDRATHDPPGTEDPPLEGPFSTDGQGNAPPRDLEPFIPVPPPPEFAPPREAFVGPIGAPKSQGNSFFNY